MVEKSVKLLECLEQFNAYFRFEIKDISAVKPSL